MTTLLEQPLATIVTDRFRTASVFEKYNLDFCCRGKKSLQDACREKKINPALVLLDLEKVLEETEESIDFNAMTMKALAEYIVDKHHEYVNREMPVIQGYLQKVSSKHGGRYPQLHTINSIFTEVVRELEAHMQKEEKILFPRIAEAEKLQTETGLLPIHPIYINAPVSVMEHEHDHAGGMMQDIRELSGNYCPPADACTTFKLCYASLKAFEEDLHRHVHLENNILFKRAIELF